MRLQPSEDLDRSWGKVAATTGKHHPSACAGDPFGLSPRPAPTPTWTLSPHGEFWALAVGVPQVMPVLGDIRGCPMQLQDAATGVLDISAGSRLLDCPRLWPELAHTYSGWSLSSWAATAISSAGRGFSAFLHLLLASFLLGWAGGWGVQVPPVPSACRGGDAFSRPAGKQRCCFPEDLLKGACSRTWEPGDSAPRARHHG